MRELQDREIGPEDYDLLLQLESKSNGMTMPKFLAIAYQKSLGAPQGMPPSNCVFCEFRETDPKRVL